MTEQIFFNFPSSNDFNIKKEEGKNSRAYKTRQYVKSIEEEIPDLDLNLDIDIDINKEEKKFSNKIKNKVVKQKSTLLSSKERTINNSLLAYITDMRNNDTVKDILTAEEEMEYAVRIEAGDEEAKKEFAKHNLRLVVSVAKTFFSRKNFFAEGDIIQEGNIGLMNAIAKFDYRKGVKFSTYAVFWIEQSIRRAFEDKAQMIGTSFVYVNKKAQ